MTYPAAELNGQDAQIGKLRPHTRKIGPFRLAARLDTGKSATPAVETRAIVAEDGASLRQYLADWETLAEDALEPNVFYEPWMLMPAIDAYGTKGKLIFVLVFVSRQGHSGSDKVLGGLFPLEKRRSYQPVPATILSLWKHPHCYLCTPLLKAGHARASLMAFFDWLALNKTCGALELRHTPAEGPFRELLEECMSERGLSSVVVDTFERAFIHTADNIDRYMQEAISGKGRRELKRKVHRLSELGILKYEELSDGGDVDAWIEDFLRLEARGWKGAERTALACSERDGTFFKLIAKAAFKKRRLLIGALTLNNKTIAIQCGFFSGSGYFAFKSAFDETYGRFSPGVLLLLEVISSVHRYEGMLWMDSCTRPDNFMANRLFAERRGIQELLVATGRSGSVLICVMRAIRRIKQGRSVPVRGPEGAAALKNEVSA